MLDYEDSGFYRKLKSLRFHFTFSDIRQALRKPRRFWDRWSLILLSFHGAISLSLSSSLSWCPPSVPEVRESDKGGGSELGKEERNEARRRGRAVSHTVCLEKTKMLNYRPFMRNLRISCLSPQSMTV